MPELIIRFDGDWRIGAGKGLRGEVDDRVRRDGVGLPFVPARTLTGMWRDGCERVAGALDAARTGPWHAWVSVVFGSQPNVPGHDHAPTPAALSVRAATLPAALRAELARDPRLAASLHGVRPGVRLVAETHHPKDKHLRMVETTRGGVTLRAPVALADHDWTDAQRLTAGVLLVLGAQQITTMGGGRRRGLGRCRVELSTVDAGVLAMLDAQTPPRPAPTPVTASTAPPLPAVLAAPEWVSLRLRATCVDPVLSRSLATDGEIRGLPYVPGARVLPVVVAKARALGVDVQPLIAGAGIVCEPLTPSSGGRAARPAPRCLVAPKRLDAVVPLTNRLLAAAPLGSKPLREHWVLAPTQESAGDVVLMRPALDITMHNTVEDAAQRPTTAVGGLYSYQSIPAGTELTGRLRLRVSSDQAHALAEALTGPWLLGSSKKDDYGRVEVTASVEPNQSEPHQPGADQSGASPSDRAQAVVWLLTDAVLLADTLAPVSTVDGVVAAIGQALGHDVELVEPISGTIAQAVSFGRAEGWQTRWTRPRPTLTTVSAGSVLVLRRRDGQPIPGSALAALHRDGIGERRAEGFGRVAINDPLLDLAELVGQAPAPTAPAAAEPGGLTSDDERLLDELRRTALRREVEHRAATLGRSELGELADTSAAQRGNLRAVLRSAASAPDPRAAIERFVAGLRAAKVRSSRWPDGAEKALSTLAQPGGAWALLGIAPADRLADLESWALQRILAHLEAGGRAAASTPGDRDGA